MTDTPDRKIRPMNMAARQAAPDLPAYPEPVLGNSVATLMDSGVGNCFPGLEFDLRQLDVRFFPGLVFAFPGVTPEGPDGTQGAQLVYADTTGDPVFGEPWPWVETLAQKLNGPEGAALGSGQWYLHWVEQKGRRIELYDVSVWQNARVCTPYEGEIAWWIIRLIERSADPAEADLAIALTQRDAEGQPTGLPVVLAGKRRAYLDGEGMIPDVYHPGELTASMCSPWTHDFRDCACQYWASNHPDVVLGEVPDPNDRGRLQAGQEAAEDPLQPVSFLDWMRRRSDPAADVQAATTIDEARRHRYDPYEINLHWQELDFVLQGQEANATPAGSAPPPPDPGPPLEEICRDLRGNLGPLEFILALRYLYATFSIRAPEEVTAAEEAAWPGLAADLRAARQILLSVAISEMTHLRWVNQILWSLTALRPGRLPPYLPVVGPAGTQADQEHSLSLDPARPEIIAEFVELERPGGSIDTEYAQLVAHLRDNPDYPPGLFQLAVRIDSDGLQHYHKFRDIHGILAPYDARPGLYLRGVALADPQDPRVQPALDLLDAAVSALSDGYRAEAETARSNADRAASRAVRMRAKWDPDPVVKGAVSADAPGLYLEPAFQDGLRRLAARGLAFEASIYHPQIPDVAAAARAVPEAQIVLIHTGSPVGHASYRGREAEVLADWTRDMRDLARCPNVTVKLGGLLMTLAAYDFGQAERPIGSEALAELWRPYVERSIEIFGPDRCMVSSNFPVERAGITYGTNWNMFKRLTAGAGEGEKRQIYSGTAKRVYRLDES
ncbi:amidohydrolase family protein [Mangrovicoccus ximenensis]|uniref:amidohydrolase family protein n=1 Tax=Mangrovicoccus ximenensis TaxID=1911570 RepID=UPI000D376345|nr:amidohydrolase family protein [Mangrovicoccus ximenensis]